jgi:hypothetical protein
MRASSPSARCMVPCRRPSLCADRTYRRCPGSMKWISAGWVRWVADGGGLLALPLAAGDREPQHFLTALWTTHRGRKRLYGVLLDFAPLRRRRPPLVIVVSVVQQLSRPAGHLLAAPDEWLLDVIESSGFGAKPVQQALQLAFGALCLFGKTRLRHDPGKFGQVLFAVAPHPGPGARQFMPGPGNDSFRLQTSQGPGRPIQHGGGGLEAQELQPLMYLPLRL